MPEDAPANGIRLNKHIADSGLCARRKADELIGAGRVQVNGVPVRELGTRINPQSDRVTVDGQPLPSSERFYLAFHKPAGYVTSRRGGRNQKTFYELLPAAYRSGDPAGRLDQETSGLLILSNDGAFIHRVSHPRYHQPKVYEVSLDHPLQAEDQAALEAGVLLTPEQKWARMHEVQPLALPAAYRVTLITGYNRQIRRSFALRGYRVRALKRLAFGPVRLGDLPPGEARPLTEAERESLMSQPSAPPPPPEQGKHRSQDKDRKPQKQAQHHGQRQTGH